MKKYYKQFLHCAYLIILIGSFAFEINPSEAKISGQLVQNTELSIDDIEKLLKKNLDIEQSVIYRHAPRGLIVSINSSVFFKDGDNELKENSEQILDKIGKLLKSIDKPCLIEGHAKYNLRENYGYTYNWEIATVRAEKIVNYLIKKTRVDPEKIRAIGFGEIVPDKNFDKEKSRIDFVIFNYQQ